MSVIVMKMNKAMNVILDRCIDVFCFGIFVISSEMDKPSCKNLPRRIDAQRRIVERCYTRTLSATDHFLLFTGSISILGVDALCVYYDVIEDLGLFYIRTTTLL